MEGEEFKAGFTHMRIGGEFPHIQFALNGASSHRSAFKKSPVHLWVQFRQKFGPGSHLNR